MSKSPLTQGEFSEWLRTFMPLTEEEQFQEVNSMEEAASGSVPDMHPLKQILTGMNARLPGLMQTMCAMYIPDSAIDVLSQSDWTPRANFQGGQNAPAR